jgi:hypothetical protein
MLPLLRFFSRCFCSHSLSPSLQFRTDSDAEIWLLGLQWLLRRPMADAGRMCISKTTLIFRRLRWKLAEKVCTRTDGYLCPLCCVVGRARETGSRRDCVSKWRITFCV